MIVCGKRSNTMPLKPIRIRIFLSWPKNAAPPTSKGSMVYGKKNFIIQRDVASQNPKQLVFLLKREQISLYKSQKDDFTD